MGAALLPGFKMRLRACERVTFAPPEAERRGGVLKGVWLGEAATEEAQPSGPVKRQLVFEPEDLG